jgi:pyrroline-5-carboxylate reductase
MTIAILGAGNIGISLARGLAASEFYEASNITLVRRNVNSIKFLEKEGFVVDSDAIKAVKNSELIVFSVLPQQLNQVMVSISSVIDAQKHIFISMVSGVTCAAISSKLNSAVPVIRAIPNTAIALKESMTCISTENANNEQIRLAQEMFDSVGKTLVIHEELMTSATALCACGIAFFLRAIRAASQGGIELGFHADEALKMAAQTAKGSASLILESGAHPESEIDKVTSPKGCTIAGLNEMEYKGFSAALIKGIKVSAKKAGELYDE